MKNLLLDGFNKTLSILFIACLLLSNSSVLAGQKEWLDFETDKAEKFLIYGYSQPKMDSLGAITEWRCNNIDPYRDSPYTSGCPGTIIQQYPYGQHEIIQYRYEWSVNDYTGGASFQVYKRNTCPESHPNGFDSDRDGKIDICVIDSRNSCPSIQIDGNPVNCATGQKIETDVVYTGGGIDPLTYTSSYTSSVIEPSDSSVNGEFVYNQGMQRYGNQGMSLTVEYNKKNAKVLRLTWGGENRISYSDSQAEKQRLTVGDGKSRIYYGNNGKPFKDPTGKHGQITENGGEFVYTNNKGKTYKFSAGGRLTEKTQPNGFKHTYTYTETGKIKSVTNHFGKKLQYFYNNSDQLAQLIDPENRNYWFEYDDNNNLVKIIYPDNTPATITDNPYVEYLFEDPNLPNHLTGKKNEKGVRFASWSYDSYGRALTSEHSGGIEKVEFDYSVANQTRIKKTVSESVFHEKIYHFEKVNDQELIKKIEFLECSDCVVGTSEYEYNEMNFLTKMTSPNGSVVEFERNSKGLVTKQIKAKGKPSEKHILTEWNSYFPSPNKITEDNLRTDYFYDANRRVRAINQWDLDSSTVKTTSYTFTAEGLVASVNGTRSDVNDITNFAYHSDGNLHKVTNSLGHVTTFLDYDNNGRAGKVIDPNGRITLLTYSPRGWLIESSVNNAKTSYSYYPTGSVQSITAPSGYTISYEYDNGKRLIATYDNLGNRVEYTLDLMGNTTQTIVRDGEGILKYSQSSIFNALGQLTKILGNNGQIIESAYDAEGNTTEHSNALNNSSSASYDALNRLVKTIDPELGETSYTYNSQDLITSVTDAEGRETQYEYNAFGELTKLISPDTGVTAFTYDKGGNILTKTDARGETVTYTYDALNRIKTQSYSDTSENVIYTYDETANGNKGIGRLTSVSDQTGTTSFVYNSFGNVIKETRVIDGKSFVTLYHYDSVGQLTGVTYPTGRKLTYTFDGVGRVTGLSSEFQTESTQLANNIDYLPFGPMNSLTYGNGKVLTQNYDLDYRLTSSAVSGIKSLTYEYDLTNNISNITDSESTAENQTFTYDKLSRLLTANGVYGDVGFSYDKVGNRKTKNKNSTTSTYNYSNDSHRLISVGGANAISMTHDQVGNTLTQADLTFTYNKQSRMKSASKPGMNANYFYNFKGERSYKLVNGIKTYFIFDLNGQLIAEANETGAIEREYVYVNGHRIATIVNGVVYYVHTDHLGTPTALTDAAQNIVWQASYTPFGKATVEVSTIENNIRFPGQYYDAETGLHYNYFRDYDPEIGRYIQSDPIGLAGGINTYGYVLQNPINGIDRKGLFTTLQLCANNPVACAAAGIGGGTGVISGALDAMNNPCATTEDILKQAAMKGALGAVTGFFTPLGGSIYFSVGREVVNSSVINFVMQVSFNQNGEISGSQIGAQGITSGFASFLGDGFRGIVPKNYNILLGGLIDIYSNFALPESLGGHAELVSGAKSKKGKNAAQCEC